MYWTVLSNCTHSYVRDATWNTIIKDPPGRWHTKAWRFGNVWGGARSRQEKIQLKSCRGVVGKKKIWNFPRRDTLARSYSKFFLAWASLVSPKCTNSSPWQGKRIIIPRQELLARKKLTFFLVGAFQREKIRLFDPRNSCHAPNWLITPNGVSGKNGRGLVNTAIS